MIDCILPLISVTDIFNAKEFSLGLFRTQATFSYSCLWWWRVRSFLSPPRWLCLRLPIWQYSTEHMPGQDMNVYVVVLVATLGAIAGAMINYGLSVWIGRPIVYKFADSRLGHACMIDRAKVEKAEKYFDDHGASSTFVGRLIPAVRQLISIPAGIARMNLLKFVVFTGLGALLWNAILAGLGVLLASYVSVDDLLPQIEKYNSYLSLAGLLILLICVAVILYNAFKTKKQA